MFRAVFDNAFEAVLLLDDDGCFVDANPAASTLFGLSRDELLGRLIGGFVEPGTDIADLWRGFLSSGEATGAYVLVRSDGARRDTRVLGEGARLAGTAPHRPSGRHRAQRPRARALARTQARERRPSRRRRRARFQQHAHGDSRLCAVARRAFDAGQPRASRCDADRHRGRSCGGPDGAAARARTARRRSSRRSSTSTSSSRSSVEMAGRIVGDTLEVTYDLDPDVCRVRVDPGADPAGAAQLDGERAPTRPAGTGRSSSARRTPSHCRTAHEDGAFASRVGRGLRCRPRRGRDRAISSSRSSRRRTSAQAWGSVWRASTGSRSRAAARSSSTARPVAARSSRSICPSNRQCHGKGDGNTRLGVLAASRFAVRRNVVLGAFGGTPLRRNFDVDVHVDCTRKSSSGSSPSEHAS